ncbi:MAG: Flp family type IVb pilin [Vicinamibacterales bacterium]
MKTVFGRLLNEQRAQDLIEYGLLASLIALTALSAVEGLGVAVGDYVSGVLARAATLLTDL